MSFVAPARLLSGVCLVALAAASPSLADTLDARSRIDAVTVYPDAASVTRVAEVDLPAGSTSLVFHGLPLTLDPASLRVSGEGGGSLAIGSAQIRSVAAAAPPQNGETQQRLKALRAERDAVQARLSALESKRDMIQRYAQASPEKLGPETGPLPVDRWSAAWAAVGTELAHTAQEMNKAKVELSEIQERIRALETSNRPPDQSGRPTREVVVELEAAQAGRARVAIAYRVAGASWSPLYDARLATPKAGERAQMELVRRAQVRQRTGEDWRGVSLSLSTARARRGAQAPELQTEILSFWEPPPPPVVLRNAPGRAADSMAMEKAQREAQSQRMTAAPAPAAAPAFEREATVDAGAYEAAFRIPGAVDIPGDGSQRTVRISSHDIPVELRARTTPALDQTAYLEAGFVNAAETPLLPGQVALHRDGMYVGRGRLELTPPGAQARLGFGADDRIKVERAPVRRKENEPSWFGSTKQEVREFKTVVKNLHDFPITAMVVDRVPISENAAISVELLPATTSPTTTNLDDRRGVMAWTFDLAPGAAKDVRLAYRMRWPADREVVFEDAPNPGGRPIPVD